jgi:hypothetical protein
MRKKQNDFKQRVRKICNAMDPGFFPSWRFVLSGFAVLTMIIIVFSEWKSGHEVRWELHMELSAKNVP